MLYELLTGEPPYTGPTAQAIVAKRLTDPVPVRPPASRDRPARAGRVLERLLAKSPADRYASAGELACSRRCRSRTASGCRAPRAPSLPLPPQPRPSPRSRPPGPYRRSSRRSSVPSRPACRRVRVIATGRAHASAALDPASVAVLPFRVTAPDRSLDYLGEGIVDLLAVKLDGSAAYRAVVPPRQLLAALDYQPGMDDPARRRRRRRPAHRRRPVLDGSLVRSGPRGLELSATLRRTDGARPRRARRGGGQPRLAAGAGGPARRAAAGGAGRRPCRRSASSPPPGRITAYLQGKAADRRGRYQEAVADYGEALPRRFHLRARRARPDSVRGPADQRPETRAPRPAGSPGPIARGSSPKGRVLLRAWLGPKYPEPSSHDRVQIAAWQEAVGGGAGRCPTPGSSWAIMQLHYGGLNDLPKPRRARRGELPSRARARLGLGASARPHAPRQALRSRTPPTSGPSRGAGSRRTRVPGDRSPVPALAARPRARRFRRWWRARAGRARRASSDDAAPLARPATRRPTR